MKDYFNFPSALAPLIQYGEQNNKGESFKEYLQTIDDQLGELFQAGIRVELITAYDAHIGTVYSVQGINLNYCKITADNTPEKNYRNAQVKALDDCVSVLIHFIYQITDGDAIIQLIGTGGHNPELFNIQFSIN